MSLPDGAAVEQLPRVKSGSFITPTRQQDKQSSVGKCHWQQSCDHIKNGQFCCGIVSAANQSAAGYPKPAVTKAGLLTFP